MKLMNKPDYFKFIFVIFFASNLYSLNEFTGHSARTKAMGEAVCGVADSVESIYYNPAGLHTVLAPQVSLGYQILWMLLTEEDSLGNGYVNVSFPFKKVGSFCLGYSNFNISNLYQEHVGIFTYSNKLFDSFYGGFNAKYLSVVYTIKDEIVNNSYFSTYGNQTSNFSFDIGFLYKKEKFSIGTSFQNLNQPKLTLNPEEKDFLKIKVNTGIGVRPSKTFIIGLDISFDTTLKLAFGLEKLLINEGVSIRAGGNYNLKGTGETSLGFGYRIPISFGGIVLNYSFSYPLTSITNTAGHHFVSFLIDFDKTSIKEISDIEKKKIAKYDEKQLKEEIIKSLKPQPITLDISKEILKKEDREIIFKIKISTEIELTGWQLVITDDRKKVVKKFYSNKLQEEIPWDLKTDEGKYILPGKYSCFVIGIDNKENKVESQIKTFILSEKLQIESPQQETIMCPNCGAENIKGERFCVRCREPL
ncbi:MAG: type IX secretion system membrane protein PorP/SprF [Endomicrobiia bacterium]